MPGKLVFGLALPGKDFTVAKRLLKVFVAEKEVYSEFISPDLAELVVPTIFQGRHGDVVRTVLVDYDDAGNASPETVNTFVLQDVIPPPAPGDVVLKVLYEEPDAAAVVSSVIPEPTIIAEEQTTEETQETTEGTAEAVAEETQETTEGTAEAVAEEVQAVESESEVVAEEEKSDIIEETAEDTSEEEEDQ